MLTAVESTALPRSPLPLADQQPPMDLPPQVAFLALQGKLKPNEVAYRRARLRGARRFFGLDIHKEYALASAVDGELNFAYGPVNVTWERFPAWIKKTLTKDDAVVIEMTTNSWDTYDQLVDHCHSVTVVHPPDIKLITDSPVMTDKKACEALSMLLAAGLLRPVWVPDEKHRQWRHLVATRHDRVVGTTQAKNRLHSILHRHQLQKPKTKVPFSASQREWWLALPLSPVEKLSVRQWLDTIEFNQKHIAEIEQVMTQELLADERMPYLIQLPGIGVVGAMTILSAIGPIDRFPDERHLVGYAGLGAKVHASGKKFTTGRITKTGRIDLRSAMVTAAHRAKRFHPFWKAEYREMAGKIGKQKAVVAIARRLLVSIWHILKKHEVDQHASEVMIARAFFDFAHNDAGVANLPDGMTTAEFTRLNLDKLGIGKDLVKVMYGRHTYLLPQSSLLGAAPAVVPTGNGQRQNTKAAQAERAAKAQAKRDALAAKQAEAEARMGRPRKTRADKGTQRGPHKK
jgi:transposase